MKFRWKEHLHPPISLYFQIAGVIIGAAGLGWAIYIRLRPHPAAPCEACVFVADDSGNPMRVLLVGPDGADLQTDSKGICHPPARWLGKRISIRRADDLREIQELSLPRRPACTIKVVISK